MGITLETSVTQQDVLPPPELVEALGASTVIGPLLGRSQGARVWSGTLLSGGHQVAIKVTPAIGSSAHLPRPPAAALTGAAPGASEQHPSLVRVYSEGLLPRERLKFVVMERVHGPTLARFLEDEQERVELGEVLELFSQVAQGIDALHRQHVIHCDIKPQNIFVAQPLGVAKIGDFGIALQTDETHAVQRAPETHGTPAYVAPEQVIGTHFGPPADVYAFAMTLYTLLTRRLAFDAARGRDLFFAQVHLRPVPLRRRNPAWPRGVETAIMRSLSKVPEERHANAAALVRELYPPLRAFLPVRFASFFDGTIRDFESGEVPINF